MLCLLAVITINIRKANQVTGNRPVVKIGALYPMSGSAGTYGKAAQKVADIFIQEFNQTHPNRKYDYKIIFEDVEMSTAKAVSATRKLKNLDNVDAVFSLFSAMAIAIKPIAQQEHFINMVWGSDPRAADGDYSFRFAVNLEQFGNMHVKKMQKDGITRISSVVQADDVGSVTRNNAIKKAVQQSGLTVTGTHEVFPNDKDFTTLLFKIKDEKPDVIVFTAYTGISDLFLTRMKRLDINIPVIGGGAVTSLADKSLAEGSWCVEEGSFDQVFMKKIGSNDTLLTEFLWAMLQIVTEAFENTEQVDGKKPPVEAVVQTLKRQTVDMQTPLGKINIGPNGEIYIPAVYKAIKDGKIVPVKEMEGR